MRRVASCVSLPVCSAAAAAATAVLTGRAACYSTPGKMKVHVKTRDEVSRVVDEPVGMRLLEVLRDVAKLDVAGSCNGKMECGTCHVYLSESSFRRVPEPSEREEDLLAKALEVREMSRLSCQIMLSADSDGLEVELPSYMNQR